MRSATAVAAVATTTSTSSAAPSTSTTTSSATPTSTTAIATTTTTPTPAVATPCVVTSNAAVFVADFVSSWFAYVVALFAAHPVDTLRVRRQQSDAPVLRIIRADGLRSLYAGFGTPVFSNAPLVAAVFALNELFRTFFRWVNVDVRGQTHLQNQAHFTHSELFAAGASAGFMSSLFSNPFSFIKVQQQSRAKAGQAPPSAWSVAREVVESGGVRKMFRGLPLEAGCSGVGRGVYFLMYEVIKSQIDVVAGTQYSSAAPVQQQQQQHSSSSSNSTSSSSSSSPSMASSSSGCYIVARNVVAAAACSSIGWLPVYPLEVVKIRMHSDSAVQHQRKYANIRACAGETMKMFGLRGFYRGFTLTMMRSWLSSGLALPLFEFAKPRARALVPRCPEDTTPSERFGQPTTSIRDLFADEVS